MRGARRAIAAASFAVALLVACSTRPAGLELIIATDLKAPDDFDTMHLHVSQDGTPAADDIPLDEPGTAPFPVTFAIAAGSRADQEAIIDVSLLKAGQVVVSRQAQVQVPKDRVAELTLVLGKKCVGVTCQAGETCDPQPAAGAGECVPIVVDPAALPTFTPADVDAAAVATSPGVTQSGSGGGSGSGSGDAAMAADIAIGNGAADATPEDAVDDAVITDVSIDDGVTNPPADVPCVPTSSTEICTNGIDDNCDGLVDCAELSCQMAGYACVGSPPAGWSGPDLFWTGSAGATAPACPAGYQSMNGYSGPTGTNGSCACTCVATGQACTATVTFHTDQTCAVNPACRSVTVMTMSGNGACTPITPTSNCGPDGSFAVAGGVPAPSVGTCTPQVTKTSGSAEGWTSAARVCTAIADVPGGCAAGGQQCVLESPSTFGAAICVHQSGDASCPAGYPTKSVIYGGETDMRGCGPCTCSSKPTGGSCAGTISIWGDLAGGCSGAAADTYTLGATCSAYAGASNNPAYAQGNFTVTPGTCTVVTQPTPTGAVIATGPTTVCCTN